MGQRNVPQPFAIDKIRFKDCFTEPSLRRFVVLITGWALTVGTHTIGQVILTMGLHESEHFANVCKFLLKSGWDADKVALKIFRMIVETLLPATSPSPWSWSVIPVANTLQRHSSTLIEKLLTRRWFRDTHTDSRSNE